MMYNSKVTGKEVELDKDDDPMCLAKVSDQTYYFKFFNPKFRSYDYEKKIKNFDSIFPPSDKNGFDYLF